MNESQFDLKTILAIVAIITSVVVAYAANWWRNRKSITFEIVSTFELFALDDTLPGEFTLLYNEKSVENLFVGVIEFVNAGKQPILKTDFEQAIKVRFPENCEVLSAQIIQTSPESFQPQIDFDSNTTTVSPTLMNPQDRFRMRVLLTEDFHTLNVLGRIVGVREISESSHLDRRARALNFLILPFGLIVATTFYFMGRVHFQDLDATIKASRLGEPPPPPTLDPLTSQLIIAVVLLSSALFIICLMRFARYRGSLLDYFKSLKDHFR